MRSCILTRSSNYARRGPFGVNGSLGADSANPRRSPARHNVLFSLTRCARRCTTQSPLQGSSGRSTNASPQNGSGAIALSLLFRIASRPSSFSFPTQISIIQLKRLDIPPSTCRCSSSIFPVVSYFPRCCKPFCSRVNRNQL